MSTDYFLAFFLLFAASGLFLWLIGAAAFYRRLGHGIALPRAMARICIARCAPPIRASVPSD